MERTVFNLSKLDNEKIRYKKMTKYVRIRYDKSKLMLRTPLLKVSEIERGDKINVIKLRINNENSKELNFGESLVNLDKFILNSAKENSEWFNEGDYSYIGLIENNEITFKFKNSDNVKIKCNGESIDINELKKGYSVKVIFDVSGIYINKSKFGIYLKPYLIDIDVDYIFDSSDEEIVSEFLENKLELSSSENDEIKIEENNIEMNI